MVDSGIRSRWFKLKILLTQDPVYIIYMSMSLKFGHLQTTLEDNMHNLHISSFTVVCPISGMNRSASDKEAVEP